MKEIIITYLVNWTLWSFCLLPIWALICAIDDQEPFFAKREIRLFGIPIFIAYAPGLLIWTVIVLFIIGIYLSIRWLHKNVINKINIVIYQNKTK